MPRAALNGLGALLTALAGVILVTTKFTEGAWMVVVVVPLLMLLFARIEHYYTEVGRELALGTVPDRPRRTDSLVIVPLGGVSRLARHALTAAIALGDEVVAVTVEPDQAKARELLDTWARWQPGVRLDVIESPHRSLVLPILSYVRRMSQDGRQIAVLIPEIQPRHARYRILQNQRGILLATILRYRTDAVVCLLPYRLDI